MYAHEVKASARMVTLSTVVITKPVPVAAKFKPTKKPARRSR